MRLYKALITTLFFIFMMICQGDAFAKAVWPYMLATGYSTVNSITSGTCTTLTASSNSQVLSTNKSCYAGYTANLTLAPVLASPASGNIQSFYAYPCQPTTKNASGGYDLQASKLVVYTTGTNPNTTASVGVRWVIYCCPGTSC